MNISPFEKGFVVSHIVNGEWTAYKVPSPAATNLGFKLFLRVSTRITGEQVTVEVDGLDKVTVDLPNTGSLSVFTDVSSAITLHPGTNTLRFTYDGDYTDFDYVPSTPAPLSCLSPCRRRRCCRRIPTPTDCATT